MLGRSDVLLFLLEIIMKRYWYAIYTRPRYEKRVAGLLTQGGIENYLPLMKSLRQWSDRKKIVEMPLFPSYIFVHINEKEYFYTIKVEGIVRFVTFEKKRVIVPDYQIEAIRKYVETGEEIIVNKEDYSVGKLVRVIHGSMKGLEGRLVELLGKQRVKVEIESIQKTLFIMIPMGNLEIIGVENEEEPRYW